MVPCSVLWGFRVGQPPTIAHTGGGRGAGHPPSCWTSRQFSSSSYLNQRSLLHARACAGSALGRDGAARWVQGRSSSHAGEPRCAPSPGFTVSAERRATTWRRNPGAAGMRGMHGAASRGARPRVPQRALALAPPPLPRRKSPAPTPQRGARPSAARGPGLGLGSERASAVSPRGGARGISGRGRALGRRPRSQTWGPFPLPFLPRPVCGGPEFAGSAQKPRALLPPPGLRKDRDPPPGASRQQAEAPRPGLRADRLPGGAGGSAQDAPRKPRSGGPHLRLVRESAELRVGGGPA